MTKPIQIKKGEVVGAARELASLLASPITEAVGQALRNELGRLRRLWTSTVDRDRRIKRILAEIDALPHLGPAANR